MAEDEFDEFEDDGLEDFEGVWMSVPVEPVNKYHFIEFFFTVVIGLLRTLLEATANLGNRFAGEEVYVAQKKEFEDEARLEIETITSENTED